MQKTQNLRIFLAGDVMTGRGIDQILSHSCKPNLYEVYVTDARDYVKLAERLYGKIKSPVSADYIWGDALDIWQQYQPDIRVVNLETAITQHDTPWPNKAVNYRMHPKNTSILKIAGIKVCTLANNHILDWEYQGLKETLLTLNNSGILSSGAGETIDQAMKPAIYPLGTDKRVLIFSAGSTSSGIPLEWRATHYQAGVYLIDINKDMLPKIAENINSNKEAGDLIIFSIHWGSNWGYEIPSSFRHFAQGLIDLAKVDIVFGHSSHHMRSIELYNKKPIFYGCGDFINDYEGITGIKNFRDDLAIMYFVELSKLNYELLKIVLIPLQIKHFRLHQVTKQDQKWVLSMINQISFNIQFKLQGQCLIFETT